MTGDRNSAAGFISGNVVLGDDNSASGTGSGNVVNGDRNSAAGFISGNLVSGDDNSASGTGQRQLWSTATATLLMASSPATQCSATTTQPPAPARVTP